MAIGSSPPRSRAASALHAACRFFERIAIVMLLLTTFLVALQVVARNIFEAGLPWADELARYGGLGIVYLAIPLLLLNDGHIAVDLISSRMKGRSGRVLRFLNEVILLGFCVVFLLGSYEFIQSAGRFSTPALRLPNFVFYLPALLGMALFTLVAVYRLVRVVCQHNIDADNSVAKGSQP